MGCPELTEKDFIRLLPYADVEAKPKSAHRRNRENRLVTANDGSADIFSAVYDYRTRRISKLENGSTTNYVYDGGVNVQELDAARSLTKQLVRGTGMGGGIGSVLYTEDASASNREFFCYNAIGSVVALANSTGTVTSTSDYEAFGNVVASSGSSTETRKFCTKERDVSIGLDNFGFRYYDAELGRFLTRDPIGYPDGPNNYIYCHNNPINVVDPLGLETQDKKRDNPYKIGPERNKRNTGRDDTDFLAVIRKDKKTGKDVWMVVDKVKSDDKGDYYEESKLRAATKEEYGQIMLERYYRTIKDVGAMDANLARDFGGMEEAMMDMGAKQWYSDTSAGQEAGGAAAFSGDMAWRTTKRVLLAKLLGAGFKYGKNKIKGLSSKSASEVNEAFTKQGMRGPYKAGTKVRTFTTAEDMQFVRVHGSGNKARSRSWMMRSKEIEGLSPAQIKSKFALPSTPTHVSQVHVPKGTKIRMGRTAVQKGWGKGGGVQYELQKELPESAFKNTRRL